EANFAKARAVVDDYLIRVTESQLLKAPGMQPLRGELLHSPLAFYRDFLKEHGDDSAIRAGLAHAYLRLAKNHEELGDAKSARANAAEAFQRYDSLAKAHPDDAELQHGLAECH